LGTPPLVVWPGSLEPRWEVSSFLLKVSAIIPAPVDSVKPDTLPGVRLSSPQRSNSLTRCSVSAILSEGLIIYSGPKSSYPDHSIRPITGGRLPGMGCRRRLAGLCGAGYAGFFLPKRE
jgi:hypothetical protein